MIFRFHRGSHVLSTTLDSITFDVPAGRFTRILQLEVKGGATAIGAIAELGLFRVTTLGSGGTPTSLALKNIDPNGSASVAGLSAKHGYATQPTIEADAVWRGAFQPLGGSAKYIALPGAELAFWSLTAYQISIRSISGTPNAAIDGELEIY